MPNIELLDSVTKQPIESGDTVRNRVTGSRYTFESANRDTDGVYVLVVDKRGDKLVLPLSRVLNVTA